MHSRTKRYVIAAIGIVFILLGVVGLFLPILQGALFIAVGVIILSITYPPAARLVAYAKNLHAIVARLLNRSEEFVERMARVGVYRRKRVWVRTKANHTLAVIADIRRAGKGPVRGVALILHGVGGAKEDPIIRALAHGAREAGYHVVRFDAADNCNESRGVFMNLTATGMREDLQAVRTWLGKQAFAKGLPVALMGHSLGGLCVLMEAADNAGEISGVATFGATIAGALTVEATEAREPGSVEKWRQQGYQISHGVACRAPHNRLAYAHLEDRMRYDLRSRADELTVPILLMVGDQDVFTPVHQQRDLCDRLQGRGTLSILEGVPHAPADPVHLNECQRLVREWLERECV